MKSLREDDSSVLTEKEPSPRLLVFQNVHTLHYCMAKQKVGVKKAFSELFFPHKINEAH